MTGNALFLHGKPKDSNTLAGLGVVVADREKIRNRLLSRLSEDAFQLIAAELEPIELPRAF